MAASVDETLATLRKNIIIAAADPQATLRLMVQGAEFWFTTVSAERLFELTVIERGDDAYARRRSDSQHEVVPAAVCVVEPLPTADGSPPTGSMATWLFRHDVLDGWRCLRYLTTLSLAHTDLTMNRLKARHEAKLAARPRGCQRLLTSAVGAVTKVAVTSALAPAALARVAKIARAPSSPSPDVRKFYLHATVSVSGLKALGKARRLGSLSATLTSAVTAAFFAADLERRRATVASNVLFDPDASAGNHVCLKVANVDVGEATQGISSDERAARVLASTARTLRAPSQRLTDLWIAMASRKYVLGHLPARWNPAIEARQQSLDLLISNLPAFDKSTPIVQDLQVSRDYDNWAPSIVYAISVDDSIFLDFYCGVPRSFDGDVFIKTFTDITDATNVHTKLPTCY